MFLNLINNVKMGPKPPMHDLEDMLVDMLIKICQSQQPLPRNEGFTFANSLKKGKVYKEKLIKFQLETAKAQ